MKKTITEEYDGDGKLIRKTIVVEEIVDQTSLICNCYSLPGYGFHFCPVHGWKGATVGVTSGEVHPVSPGRYWTTNTNTYDDGHDLSVDEYGR